MIVEGKVPDLGRVRDHAERQQPTNSLSSSPRQTHAPTWVDDIFDNSRKKVNGALDCRGLRPTHTLAGVLLLTIRADLG